MTLVVVVLCVTVIVPAFTPPEPAVKAVTVCALKKALVVVTGVSPLMKGFTIPNQITPSFELSYDNFSMEKFMTLPEFIRKKMEKSIYGHSTKTPK